MNVYSRYDILDLGVGGEHWGYDQGLLLKQCPSGHGEEPWVPVDFHSSGEAARWQQTGNKAAELRAV